MRISDWSSDVCPSDLEQCGDARPDGRIYSQPGHESDRSVDSDLEGADAGHGLRLLKAVACAKGPRRQLPEGRVPQPISRGTTTEIGRASCRERVCQYV